MDEHRTVDSTCVIRLWVERGDPVLRGRVEWVSPAEGAGPAGRGVDEIVGLLRDRLAATERGLVLELGGL